MPGRLLVLVAPHAAEESMLFFAARLALRGSLRVLDGGNRFNAYRLARSLRRLSRSGLEEALGRVWVARAFTCYQMVALLEATPAAPVPTLVVDLLGTFYDESVPLAARRRLVEASLDHLERLSGPAAVVASLRLAPGPQPDPGGLAARVQAAADLLWIAQPPAPALSPTLF